MTTKEKLKVEFDKWNLGGKIIFISSCVAVLSFLLPWVDIGIASRNGLSQGSFVFFGLFVYPLLKLLKGKDMNKYLGVGLAIVSILLTTVYIYSKRIDWFGEFINAASTGAYLFWLASAALIVGIIKYKK